MADTKSTTPRRSSKPTDPEALAFGIITSALADLDPEAVHRTLDHVAKRHGMYVATSLTATIGTGESGQQMPPAQEWDGYNAGPALDPAAT